MMTLAELRALVNDTALDPYLEVKVVIEDVPAIEIERVVVEPGVFVLVCAA